MNSLFPPTPNRRIYLTITYLLTVFNLAGFIAPIKAGPGILYLYYMLVLLGQTVIYLLPAITLDALLAIIPRLIPPCFHARYAHRLLVASLTILPYALMHFLIFVDKKIYHLYGFHINGFVMNIVVTKGGLASLGAGDSTVTGVIAIAGLFILLQTGVYALAAKLSRSQFAHYLHFPWRAGVTIALALGVIGAEKMVYGVSQLQAYTPVMLAANHFPLYLPLTIRSLAKSMGITPKRSATMNLEGKMGRLQYPRQPLRVVPPTPPMNIMMLVVESLRADMLDPEIMPGAWDLAQRSLWGKQHYSGGNGTRMGVFSLFYGLPANYWFKMLEIQQRPVLMEEICRQGYQLGLYTSARFTYPEFDHTIFANISADQLHEYQIGDGWQRDEYNVGKLIEFMEHRDPAKPFMSFMFFESPHARYGFPESAVIRPNYLKDFNYAMTHIDRDIELIKNRYINSVHFLDLQLQRLFEYLESRKLMDSTIILIVGDHGEEFMEKGRWGHNSQFSEEQIRTPLILWVPGKKPTIIDHMTSHLDIPPTLMTLLGTQNPPDDYALGYDLFGAEKRQFTLVGDWSYLAYIDQNHKVVAPFRATNMKMIQVFTAEDANVEKSQEFLSANPEPLRHLLSSLSSFSR